MGKRKMMKQRLGIYFFYDEKGIARDFVIKFIDGLHEVCDTVWVVVNGNLTDESRLRIEKIEQNIWVRENVGYDVWAYKSMMEKLGWEYIEGYKELLLCNFTCYGPIYSFQEMFSEMDKRNYDFWGVAKHPEQEAFLLPNKQGYIHEHLMSYFIVIKNRMLHSDDFKTYWEYIPEIHTKTESTAYHETVFTKYFEERGYISDAYVELSKYKDRVYNSSIILANELLIKDRCPIVKRRAFFFPEYNALLNISMANQSIELLEYIDKYTDYDVNMIWQDILQTQQMSLVHTNMFLNEVLSTQYCLIDKEQSKKIFYLIYLPKKSYVDILQKYLSNKHTLDEIVLLYSEDEVGNYCRMVFRNYYFAEKINKIDIVAGRNTLYCLKEYEKNIKDADYSCCILNYNIVPQLLRITEEDKINYIYKCCFEGDKYVSNIIQTFETKKQLGLLVPEETEFAVYYSQNDSKNKGALEKNREIHRTLGLQVPFDSSSYYDNNSAVFWIRKETAQYVLNEIQKKDVFDILFKSHSLEFFLPMLVQQAGYYVATVLPDALARVNICHQNYMKKKLIETVEKKDGRIYWRFWDLINALKREKVVKQNVSVQPSRTEVVNTHFSLKEIISIIGKYPAHKALHLKTLRSNKINEKKQEKPIYTYLRNVSIEGDRLVLYFMSGKEEINKSYIEVNNRRYYSRKALTEGQKELVKYVKEYSNAYAVFFEVPLAMVENRILKLFEKDEKQIYFKWASGISFNALELSKYGLYSRITDEGYFIQNKNEYVKGVLKSKQYSVKQKNLFRFMRLNKMHNLTIMSENLNAADNTFQLFKYCVEQGENVYYLVSKKVYDSEKNKKIKRRMVVFNSKKHNLIMLFSKRWITSFSLRGELFPTNHFFEDIHYNLLPPNWIFIPHGMAVGDKMVAMLHKYSWDNPTKTFCSTKAECLAYSDMYDFNDVTYLGAPRMDKWTNVKLNQNEIFIFFTWRMGLSKGRKSYYNSFEESDYYKIVTALVSEVRRTYPNKIIHYALHHEIIKQGYDEIIKKALEGQNINFIYLNTIEGANEFNSHFGSAKYLITDFSSVAYDFSYKENAIAIYYLEDNFIKYHYSLEEKFFEIHLGVVVKNKTELMKALAMKKPTQNMLERRKDFFYQIDDKNSSRVYEAIFKEKLLNPFYNPRQQEVSITDKKRLGIYFFYDGNGIVDDYVYYYLQELRKVCNEVCVVVNGIIDSAYKKRFELCVDKLIIRDNVGFDSWAYKTAIESYGYEKIANEYDELVLNNFTNFGPIYSFEEMFSIMDEKTCDFWGHNRYHAAKGQRLDDVPMVDHLQSYFTVFRKSLLKSKYFKQYWKTLQIPKTYIEAIKFHEIRYTKYFEELGYISSEYIPYSAYSAKHNNAPMHMAYSMMEKYHSPFLKRKIFFVKDSKWEFPLREEKTVYDILRYIKQETKYDVKLIYENIERTQDLAQEMSEMEKEKIKTEYMELIRAANTEEMKMRANACKNQIYSYQMLKELIED